MLCGRSSTRDVQFEVGALGIAGLTTFRGPDGVMEFYLRWLGSFEDWGYDTEELIDGGDSVVVRIHQWGRREGQWTRRRQPLLAGLDSPRREGDSLDTPVGEGLRPRSRRAWGSRRCRRRTWRWCGRANFAAWNAGDMDAFRELCDAGVVMHHVRRTGRSLAPRWAGRR